MKFSIFFFRLVVGIRKVGIWVIFTNFSHHLSFVISMYVFSGCRESEFVEYFLAPSLRTPRRRCRSKCKLLFFKSPTFILSPFPGTYEYIIYRKCHCVLKTHFRLVHEYRFSNFTVQIIYFSLWALVSAQKLSQKLKIEWTEAKKVWKREYE